MVKAAPDRAVLVLYGTTYEGRTLYYLIIAKPEHLQRREEIRDANLQLADPRKFKPAAKPPARRAGTNGPECGRLRQ